MAMDDSQQLPDLIRAIIALDRFPVGLFATDLDGRCIAVNARWCQISGQTIEQALGLGYLDAIHPEDRERVIETSLRHMREDRPLRVEYRVVRPDGRINWVLVQGVALILPGGERIGYAGVVTDISRRVATEAALRESEERYRLLIEQNPTAVAVHRGGVVQYVNEAAVQLMRASGPGELLGRHVLEFVTEEYHPLVLDRVRRVTAGEAVGPAEMDFRCCDGTVIRVETIAGPTVFGGEPATQLWVRDVTEQRKVDALYRAVVESVRDPIWIADVDAAGEWRLVFVNQAYCRGAQVSPADIVGKSSRELAEAGYLDPERAKEREASYRQAAASAKTIEYEMRGTWAGRPFYISTTLTPVAGPDGRFTRIVGWSRDLSRRIEQERKLAESEANYRMAVEGTSDAFWVVDKEPDGGYRCRLANRRTAEMLRTTVE
uniref:PAS domain S-box protein n=1 Tax=Tepidiforma sp. TaxID=2682230 RepID=UPI002ADD706C